MGPAASTERKKIHVPIDAPWLLGDSAECVIVGAHVTLRDTGAGAEVRLTAYDFAGRKGRVLRFRSRVGRVPPSCIDFAGMGRDAQFEVACADEATAAMVAARLEQVVADFQAFLRRLRAEGQG